MNTTEVLDTVSRARAAVTRKTRRDVEGWITSQAPDGERMLTEDGKRMQPVLAAVRAACAMDLANLPRDERRTWAERAAVLYLMLFDADDEDAIAEDSLRWLYRDTAERLGLVELATHALRVLEEKPARKKKDWRAEALMLLSKHPEKSDAEIAREVGIHPSQLSRFPAFQKMRKLLAGNTPPRGHKANDGSIEAYDDDF